MSSSLSQRPGPAGGASVPAGRGGSAAQEGSDPRLRPHPASPAPWNCPTGYREQRRGEAAGLGLVTTLNIAPAATFATPLRPGCAAPCPPSLDCLGVTFPRLGQLPALGTRGWLPPQPRRSHRGRSCPRGCRWPGWPRVAAAARGPAVPSAGNKGSFLPREWAQCEQPPAGGAGVSGTPRARSYSGKGHGAPRAQGRLCAVNRRAGAPLGTGGDTKGRNGGTRPALGLFAAALPLGLCLIPCPQPCDAPAQHSSRERWHRDVLARWHSRPVYLPMFSSIDKSIIDDTLSWAWQSSARAPIVSIQ